MRHDLLILLFDLLNLGDSSLTRFNALRKFKATDYEVKFLVVL